jgi:hypothetical protein
MFLPIGAEAGAKLCASAEICQSQLVAPTMRGLNSKAGQVTSDSEDMVKATVGLRDVPAGDYSWGD